MPRFSEIRRFGFTYPLGWSYTRYDTFTQCKRKYYFEYYRKRDIENVARIEALRELTSVPLEIGNISHKLIIGILTRLQKSADEIDRDRFYAWAQRKAQTIFAKKKFEEVHYGKAESIDFVNEIFRPVMTAMINFFESPRLRWLYEEALLTRHDWFIEAEENENNFEDKYLGECRIDEQKAYCKVDFMFPVGDELHIIDWKTGKQDGNINKHTTQLKGYAGWAKFQFGAEYSKVKPTAAYLLPEYSENSIDVNEYDLDEFSGMIRRQTEHMKQYCEDADQNIPRPKEEFPMTEKMNLCGFCKYRELCGRA